MLPLISIVLSSLAFFYKRKEYFLNHVQPFNQAQFETDFENFSFPLMFQSSIPIMSWSNIDYQKLDSLLIKLDSMPNQYKGLITRNKVSVLLRAAKKLNNSKDVETFQTRILKHSIGNKEFESAYSKEKVKVQTVLRSFRELEITVKGYEENPWRVEL